MTTPDDDTTTMTTASNDDPPTTTTYARRPYWQVNVKLLAEECAASDNPYQQAFAASPLATIFQTNVPIQKAFGKSSRTRIRKELVESAALESRLKRVLLLIDNDDDSDDANEQIVIWDLCSSKGFSSLWLTCNTFANNNNVQVHMVDNSTKLNMSWLEDNTSDDDKNALFGNHSRRLTFHRLDLYSKELEEKIKASVAVDTKKLILVGIHTCGDLSRRALELGQLCGAHATLVCPCCCVRPVKPIKRPLGSFGYDISNQARKFNGQVSVYQLWCWMLWGYAQSEQQRRGEERTRQRIDLTCEPIMKTDKNVWLTVINEQEPQKEQSQE